MNELEKLIDRLVKEKGGTKAQYRHLLDLIATHESGNDPTKLQYEGGPGRGKFQFEEGEDAGGITAAKRTLRYYKNNDIPVPQWLSKAAKGNSLNASNLTSEQQDILFLGNMREHPEANFRDVWSGKKSIKDFWADYHWAGDDADRPARLKSFDNTISSYNRNKKVPPLEEPVKTPLESVDDKPIDMRPKNIEIDRAEDPFQDLQKPQSNTWNEKLDEVGKSIREFFLGPDQKAMGGSVNSSSLYNKDLTHFEGGGTHEQNKYGGIPQGMGSNGRPNTVEEGETAYKLPQGKYIFSDRIKTDGSVLDYIKSKNKMAMGGPGDGDKGKFKKKLMSPERIEGESDENYQHRLKYLEHQRKQNLDPLAKGWEAVKEEQDKLGSVYGPMSEILTSPIDIAYHLRNKIDPTDTEKYKSKSRKQQENVQAMDAVTDAAMMVVPLKNPFSYSKGAGKVVQSEGVQALTKLLYQPAEEVGFEAAANQFANGGPVDPPTKLSKGDETGRNFIANWMANPITRQRYADNMGISLDQANTDLNEAILKATTASTSVHGAHPTDKGRSTDGHIFYYGEPTKRTGVHERTHESGIDRPLTEFINYDMNANPYTSIKERTGKSDTYDAIRAQMNLSDSMGDRKILQEEKERMKYVGGGGEMYARLMEIRQELGLVPGQVVTEDMLNSIYENNFNDLTKYWSKKKMAEVLNTVASTNNNLDKYKGLV